MHGLLWNEAKVLADFGLSNEKAVGAITKNAARACQIEDKLGTLETGKIADFIALKENPLKI